MFIHATANRLPFPQPESQPKHKSGHRWIVVQHDPCCATRLQHAPRFVDATDGVWAVVHHSIGINNIKGFIRKGQILSVGYMQIVF